MNDALVAFIQQRSVIEAVRQVVREKLSGPRAKPRQARARTSLPENQSGSTRMGLRNLGLPSGSSRFVAPFMAMAKRRANRKDLASLKELIERTEKA